MKTGYQNKSLLLNSALRGHDAGSTIRIKVDNKNVPVDPYWRNRLKDSKHDGCVEFVKKAVKKAEPKKSAQQED